MKKVILLFIAYIWVATSGYSQVDFIVSSAGLCFSIYTCWRNDQFPNIYFNQ
ncbi:MAG: hypothetical protein IPK46_22805 [Saprospiraceae bacterium]|nr:hypothetical protein [Saprospiraceae bacterium]